MSLHNFYTNTNATILFYKCALPNMASAAFIYLYVIIDGIFVGRYLGSDALAAMNLVMPFIMISFALADMIAIGSSVQIAINLGKGKIEKARAIFSFCIVLIFVISCIMGILGFFLAKPLSAFMGADENIQNLSTEYMQIFALFAPFTMLAFAMDNYLRICGKTFYSMVVNITVASSNIVLDWLFIVILEWSLFSAALATCLGMLLGTILGFIPFVFKNLILKFKKPIISLKILKNIIYNGSSEFFSNISSSIYTILANAILLKIAGNQALAAFSIILYLSTFTFALILSMCEAMQPAISYNYGYKNILRIQAIFKRMFIASGVFGVSVFLLAFFFNEIIVSLFNKNNDISFANLAQNALILFSFSFLLSWLGKLCASFFTALDKPMLSLAISIIQSLVLPFIFIQVLSYYLSLNGVWLASFASEVLMVFIASYLLYKTFKDLNS
ncbi:MATE family efflux transporter [Campylobacter lari]|uniref:Multidrug export protein MepA n=1 Tax=Campylobacter lari TaxID=201 RepID=A0A698FVH7_CAMLA|nr:MATE family efflux transporter [Campylobacter lari]ECW8955328.1 MATE family efflux transporter [Campylobacter lari]MBT0794818.1 MATE family efflux transporter [Campylobacter lari]MCR6511558.1 MATE family efflux transporter [Campylobacter lari]MCR6528384.1 MATE family efflux transporter [Campylobacter lari]MCR6537348.1 MATE family efflux transporter [Campylobacter lari]